MKKIFSLLLLLIISVSLSGCATEKPEGTVNRFFNAGKQFDFEKMKAEVDPSDTSNNETFDKSFNGEDNQYQKYFLDYLKSNATKIEYVIKESKVEGDKAVVVVNAKYVNGGPLVKETIGEVFKQALTNAFSGVEMTEEATQKLFVDTLTAKLKSDEPVLIEKTLSINCIQIDKKWYIAEISDNILDVLTSNFVSTGKEIQDSFDVGGDSQSNENSEETSVYIDKKIGDEIILATIKLKAIKVEEMTTLKPKYGDSVNAKDGAKFVVVNFDIENITKSAFVLEPNFLLIDNQDREFNTYDDAFMAADNLLGYRNLAPNIKENGSFVYEVPQDSEGYGIFIGKKDTNEIYNIVLK